jgi:hypothetical protein
MAHPHPTADRPEINSPTSLLVVLTPCLIAFKTKSDSQYSLALPPPPSHGRRPDPRSPASPPMAWTTTSSVLFVQATGSQRKARAHSGRGKRRRMGGSRLHWIRSRGHPSSPLPIPCHIAALHARPPRFPCVYHVFVNYLFGSEFQTTQVQNETSLPILKSHTVFRYR